MGRRRENHWLIGGLAAIALAISLPAGAAQQSKLSRWVSDVALPEIREMLSEHPRYRGQTVRLVRAGHDGMTEALVTVLTANLRNRDGIRLHSPVPVPPLRATAPSHIDELNCVAADTQHLQLLVSVSEKVNRQAQVDISLVEPGGAATAAQSWQWRGSFSRAERETFSKSGGGQPADGSMTAPWTERDVEDAALGLHRQLACALRPQIRTRLGLQWPDVAQLPPLMADTVYRSRHLVGAYAELGITADAPDFRVGTELKPLRDNTWQLWLTAEPLKADLAPVQAVAYFRSDELQKFRQPPVKVPYAPPPGQSGPRPGPALDYLDVEMVDAWLGNTRAGKAELQVQLRLENRAAWPIDYSLRVSAGHYQHCIPEPSQYRHDRFGRLSGRLEPGQVLVKPLVVKGAQHRPNPWFGAPSCAGFRSLEGFEEFADKGESVTEYVRWSF